MSSDKWVCSICTFENRAGSAACDMCSTSIKKAQGRTSSSHSDLPTYHGDSKAGGGDSGGHHFGRPHLKKDKKKDKKEDKPKKLSRDRTGDGKSGGTVKSKKEKKAKKEQSFGGLEGLQMAAYDVSGGEAHSYEGGDSGEHYAGGERKRSNTASKGESGADDDDPKKGTISKRRAKAVFGRLKRGGKDDEKDEPQSEQDLNSWREKLHAKRSIRFLLENLCNEVLLRRGPEPKLMYGAWAKVPPVSINPGEMQEFGVYSKTDLKGAFIYGLEETTVYLNFSFNSPKGGEVEVSCQNPAEYTVERQGELSANAVVKFSVYPAGAPKPRSGAFAGGLDDGDVDAVVGRMMQAKADRSAADSGGKSAPRSWSNDPFGDDSEEDSQAKFKFTIKSGEDARGSYNTEAAMALPPPTSSDSKRRRNTSAKNQSPSMATLPEQHIQRGSITSASCPDLSAVTPPLSGGLMHALAPSSATNSPYMSHHQSPQLPYGAPQGGSAPGSPFLTPTPVPRATSSLAGLTASPPVSPRGAAGGINPFDNGDGKPGDFQPQRAPEAFDKSRQSIIFDVGTPESASAEASDQMRQCSARLDAGQFKEALPYADASLSLLVSKGMSTNNFMPLLPNIRVCVHYKLALNVLISIKEWEGFLAFDKDREPLIRRRIAILTRQLTMLKLSPKHTAICLRMAITKNMEAQNFAFAAQLLQFLLSLRPPDSGLLTSKLQRCAESGLSNADISIQFPLFCAREFKPIEDLEQYGMFACQVCESTYSANAPGCNIPGAVCWLCCIGSLHHFPPPSAPMSAPLSAPLSGGMPQQHQQQQQQQKPQSSPFDSPFDT